MRLLQLIGIALLSATLGACGGSDTFRDLQEFMDDVDGRPKGTIEPLPVFAQVEPFAYEASNMRSPFEPPILIKRVERRAGDPSVVPDFNRTRQFLEQYSVGRLAMVGTLTRGPSKFALIKDGDGGVHRVQAGDYMGSDHGQISKVDEASIELIEIVPDGTGGWVERARTVNLGSGA
jgi:type IV pilus assembly protein PilP